MAVEFLSFFYQASEVDRDIVPNEREIGGRV